MKFLRRLVEWFKRIFAEVEKAEPVAVEGKRGRGRPKQEVCKDIIGKVRWSAVEWQQVNDAAAARGMDTSKFIRQCVIAETMKD